LLGWATGAARGGAALAQDRPPDADLQLVEQRGREIAFYIMASSKAAERLKREGSAIATPDQTLVVNGREGLRVLFLKNPDPATGQKGFLVLAETGFDPTSGDVGNLSPVVPPKTAPGITLAYTRALDTARGAAASRPEAKPPFDEAVIKEADGTFLVYLKTRLEAAWLVRAGDDLVVRVSSNGRQAVSIDALHSEAAALPLAERPPGQPTLHEHKKGDLPTPTDVAIILLHPNLAPHLVLTPRYMFRIDAQGHITFLGPSPSRTAPPAATGRGGGAP
jgi:hypothetical protein